MDAHPSSPPIDAATSGHENSSQASVRKRNAFPILAAVAGFLSVFSSVSVAQEFTEVTTQVGFANELKKSWGDPIFGDMNNDGWLDVIVPDHGLSVSHGPMVYLNN